MKRAAVCPLPPVTSIDRALSSRRRLPTRGECYLAGPLRSAAFGASSFSFSSASGIMRPNIELSIAVGINPPLFSVPPAPDIKNCGTSG